MYTFASIDILCTLLIMLEKLDIYLSIDRYIVYSFDHVREMDYMPKCFRIGMQVPLYRGKYQYVLDRNDYKGSPSPQFSIRLFSF